MEQADGERGQNSGGASHPVSGQTPAPGWAFAASAAPEAQPQLLGVVRGPARAGGGRGSLGPSRAVASSAPPASGPQPKRVLAPGVSHGGGQAQGVGHGAAAGPLGGDGQVNSYALMVPRPASSLGTLGGDVADTGAYVERRPKGDAREYEWARPAIAPRGRDGISHDGTPLVGSRPPLDVSGHGADEDGGVIPPPPLTLRDGSGGAAAGDDGVLASCTTGSGDAQASRGCVPWSGQGAGDDAAVVITSQAGSQLQPTTSGGSASTDSLTALLASGFSCLGPRARPPSLSTPPGGGGDFTAVDAAPAPSMSPHSLPYSPALSRSPPFTSSYESLTAEAALLRVTAAAPASANSSPTGANWDAAGGGSATPGKAAGGSPVFLDTATASPTSSNGGGGLLGSGRGGGGLEELHAGILRPPQPQARSRTRSPVRIPGRNSSGGSGGWANAGLKGQHTSAGESSPPPATTVSDREAVGAALKSLLTP